MIDVPAVGLVGAACPADCEGNGVLIVLDVECFQGAFVAGCGG